MFLSDSEDVYIHPTAEVSEKAKIGKNTQIWHFVHVREGAEIGENCKIGKSSYIDKNVKIGNNVKIQNMVSVYQGVAIEDDAFIGPHVVFTNDLLPRSFSKDWKPIPTLIKKGASVGANAAIICGTTVGEYAMVGAGSVVTKDVPSHALVFGNPASVKGFVCVCGRKLEKISEEEDRVAMKCHVCEKEFILPKIDFDSS
jgi:acetyltransferase-like isoleucine patch superfamily enzyme